MSGYAMEWAITAGEDKDLSSDARTVLVAVAYFASHRHGMAWCSRSEIMAKTAMGSNRVIRAVKEIEKAAVVSMIRRPNRILWGPFPVPPAPKKLSTTPRGTARTGARQISAEVVAYRTTGGALTALPGVREQDSGENQNPRAAASTWVAALPPAPNRSDLPDD